MKKFFMIALAAMSLSLVGCKKNVVDEYKKKVEDYYWARNAGYMDKAAQLDNELEQWGDSLSVDDLKKIDEFIKSDEGKEWQKKLGMTSKKSVEAQAKAYAEDMIEAMKSGDQDKIQKVTTEVMEWQKNLSEEDKKKVEEWEKSDEAKELKKKMDEVIADMIK